MNKFLFTTIKPIQMKKRLLIAPLTGLLVYAVMMGNAAGPAGAGAIDGTGASGSSIGCAGTSCHSGGASPAVSLNVELLSGTTPVTQYIAGNSYTIRLTGINTVATAAPRFGFQVAVNKTSTTTSAGTMTAVAGTHLTTVSGMSIVEHSPASLPPTVGAGGGGSTYVVNIPWTAPAAGTGTVSIRTVMNLVNNNGMADAGDRWRDMTVSITEMSPGLTPITGTTTLCTSGTTTLSNATAGGTWSCSNLTVATVGASTGVVTGLITGTAIITYDLGTSGYVTTTITVNPSPTAILGTTSGCAGGTFTLTNATAGGSWASSTPAVATVGATSGIVAGFSAGTSLISYSLSTGCRTTRIVTINGVPSAGTTGGPSTVCVGNTITLTSTVTGGTWTSADATKASVGGSSGIVTGLSAGAVTISYMVMNSCGTAYATKALTVQPITACTTLLPQQGNSTGFDLLVAPNPTKGAFTLTITGNDHAMVPVRITDLQGRQVGSIDVITNETTYITLLPPGIYLVNAVTVAGNVTRKVFIE
jgi:uncharacterized protein YjdB